MKSILTRISMVLACAITMIHTAWAYDKGEAFTPKHEDSYYLAGAVPVENGKVVFRYTLQLPGLTRAQIYEKVKEWLARSERADRNIIIERSVIKDDPTTGEIYIQNQEELIFAERGLSIDKADFAFLQHYTCSDGKCELEISHLRYVYEDDNKVPEGWITDDYALDKKKTKIIPGVLRPRVKTVDRMDDLYTGLNNSFLVSIAQVQTTPAATQPAQPLAPASPATETNKQVTTPATTIASVTPIQQPTGNPPVKSTTINEQSVAETPAPLEPPVAETPAPTPGMFAGYTH